MMGAIDDQSSSSIILPLRAPDFRLRTRAEPPVLQRQAGSNGSAIETQSSEAWSIRVVDNRNRRPLTSH